MIKVIENYQIKLKFEDKLRLLHLELFSFTADNKKLYDILNI
jgi:hypothetical protein